ncbi:septation protein SepH [Salininema proteolyticum]|uniref:Septation protein SepH n=1 Tax=Salininema proteolyticum TaxID=1607685 RepID=A0ABV8TXC1_9ACTN
MRPVRFVALSDDGQALVLADELGRLLALPLDERVQSVVDIHQSESAGPKILPRDESPKAGAVRPTLNLSPRDIQTRIRAGESADEIAMSAAVPVDRVLRYAGPVLQERAMLAQSARRARLSTSSENERMSAVVDDKLAQHGVDPDAVSWDAWRLEDASWLVQASWSSGKTTAHARWKLDRTRRSVTPDDEMAQFLSSLTPQPQAPARPEYPAQQSSRPSRDPLHGVVGEEPEERESQRAQQEAHSAGLPGSTSEQRTADGGLPGSATPATRAPSAVPPIEAPGRPQRADDPLRRDRLREVLERPFDVEPSEARGQRPAPLGLPGSTVAEEQESPEVPSLALLRPTEHKAEGQGAALAGSGGRSKRPRNELPAWDDVLFGPSR